MVDKCSYNVHKSLIGNHLDAVSKTSDLHSSPYNKIIDFNAKNRNLEITI